MWILLCSEGVRIYLLSTVSQSTGVYFVYRDGHGLGSMPIQLVHHCFSFNMR